MPHLPSQAIARPPARPWHPSVLAIPAICFVAALLTDSVYARSYAIGWKNFSDWLLAGGMVLGGLATLVGIADLARPAVRADRRIWPYAAAYAVAMVLALFDNLVHSRDAFGAMPAGLILSALTVLALLITGAIGMLWTRDIRKGAIG